MGWTVCVDGPDLRFGRWLGADGFVEATLQAARMSASGIPGVSVEPDWPAVLDRFTEALPEAEALLFLKCLGRVPHRLRIPAPRDN